jgi:hypothetical protein
VTTFPVFSDSSRATSFRFSGSDTNFSSLKAVSSVANLSTRRSKVAVDAEARRKALSVAARHVRRQETARPLLDDIRSKIEAAQSAALPSSALSKACQYALALWKKLTRFLEYPELELSTNLAENSMRPVALGRKNWLHIGSPQAGPKVAAILSVAESCRRLQVPVRDYFSAILPGLADVRIQRLSELAPNARVSSKTASTNRRRTLHVPIPRELAECCCTALRILATDS